MIASTFAASMSNILKTNYSASNNLGRGHFPSRVWGRLVVPVKVKMQQSVIVIFSSSCPYLSIPFMTSQVACLAYFIYKLKGFLCGELYVQMTLTF